MSQMIAPIHDHHDDDDHDDMGGLHRDLRATGGAMDRRRLLRMAAGWGAGLSVLNLLGCGGLADVTGTTRTTGGSSTGTGTDASGSAGGTCVRIPEETAGPYPGDGSNGANVLNLTGVVRGDIRSSFAGLSGTAAGVPLTIELTLVSATTCEVLAGRAVYLWHCDRGGLYSLYSAGATNQNYLRGVQQADANGKVRFTSIFPGCYAGRWPHVHFEIYPNLTAATDVRNKVATSQLALPKAACDAVYATAGYEASVRNLAGITLATDNVFSDGSARQVATLTGSPSEGYVASLTVAVNA
jgi:protocatechuate 3,4-dioxygenase beta subunit